MVVFDHMRRSLTIVVPCPLGGDDAEAAYWRTVATVAEMRARLSGPVPRPPAPEEEPVLGPVTSNLSREEFEAGVERAQEYIVAGDIFQVVLSQRFRRRWAWIPSTSTAPCARSTRRPTCSSSSSAT